MKKFLLGLIAVAAVYLPLSQNAQAHWATIITTMATTTLTGINATGIMAIGIPGPGTWVTGTPVQSRLLWPRIDMRTCLASNG